MASEIIGLSRVRAWTHCLRLPIYLRFPDVAQICKYGTVID
jgi:hypothetical protein